jgi:cystathionine beta-lyase/cystathionine gamma-synthase
MNQEPTDFVSRDQLERALRRILGQKGALPEDWKAESTTYDLDRFHSEDEFLDRFQRAVQRILAEDIHDPTSLRLLLAGCGLPYDYARLGQPFSTVYELYLKVRTGAEHVVAFASRSKPFLAPIEAPGSRGPVRLYAKGQLGLKTMPSALREPRVEIHENWSGPLPKPLEGTLTLYVSDQPPEAVELATISADAVCCLVEEGGVLLIQQAKKVDRKGIQVIRKRTVAALLAANAKTELQRLLGLPVPSAALPAVREDECVELLRKVKILPEGGDSAYFCTGLAAEAAVLSATAQELTAGSSAVSVRLFYADNGYGGTVQLFGEILPREDPIAPVPLPVLSRNAQGQEVTLVQRVIESLPALEGQPACLFLEIPTNPELQVHDFTGLMAALREHHQKTGSQIPVLVDTTLAPLYPLFNQKFARDWPFLIVKSGSKYLTKGAATLGVAVCGDNALARRILDRAKEYRDAADSGAKSSQLRALAKGLPDLEPRMKQIADNTRRLAGQLEKQLRLRGHDDVTLYCTSDDEMASGVLSFFLPPTPTRREELVDDFVESLLRHAPELVKNRVSYGQSTGEGKPDYFYVINPEESTQGAVPKAVKAARRKHGVPICRISVPENADVEGLLKVTSDFFDQIYR